jgi:hypothetical protein
MSSTAIVQTLPVALRITVVAMLASVSAASAATPPAAIGSWQGKIVPKERTYTVPAISLVVTRTGVASRLSGLTAAAHDAPGATTTCSVKYTHLGERGGWSYYEQTAPSSLTSAGMIEGAPCGADGRRSAGGIGYLLRLHPPQGGKLAVQVTTWDRAPRSLDDAVSALQFVGWRGYLTR